jgi:hypothetical protein
VEWTYNLHPTEEAELMSLPRRNLVRAIRLGVAAVLLAGCTLGQAPPAGQVCTLIGCGPSLELALVGEHVPTDFSLIVVTPEGGSVNVRCTDGNADFDPPEAARWSPSCPAGGVAFYDFVPAAVTVTVRWLEGETTQAFEPAYSEYAPNGPSCEPTCRAARLEVLIPELPQYGDSSTWETYTDEAHGFRIKYPPELPLVQGPAADGYHVMFVGEQIEIETSDTDPLVCRGDCPMLERIEFVTLAGWEARQARGYIGSIGGNVPQHFLRYVFRLGSEYVSFVLHAVSRYGEQTDPSVITPLRQQDIDLFERMMQTLEIER